MSDMLKKASLFFLLMTFAMQLMAAQSIYDFIQYEFNEADKTAKVLGIQKGESSNLSFYDGLTIPSSVNKDGVSYTVTEIGREAFSTENAGDWWLHISGPLILPPTLKTIGKRAFYFQKFTGGLTIPNSVTTIGEYAFYGCDFDGPLILSENLTEITEGSFSSHFSGDLIIPESVKSIGYRALMFMKIKRLKLPETITKIEENTFKECVFLEDLTIPASVKEIGSDAFLGCKFYGKVTIPNTVDNIGLCAFRCSLFYDNVLEVAAAKIRWGAFSDCEDFGGVDICYGVKEIGDEAFIRCKSLSGDLVLPESVVSVGNSAFYGTQYDNIYLPASMECVGYNNFYFDNTQQVTCYAVKPPKISPGQAAIAPVFSEYIYENVPLYVPSGSIDKYRNAYEWKNFKYIQGIGDMDVNVDEIVIDKESLGISGDDLEMRVGEERIIKVTVMPENATDKSVSFRSSNPAVASVNERGVLTALAPGHTTVNITAKSGVSTLINVSVVNTAVSSVATYVSPLKVREGGTVHVSADMPQGGYEAGWEWYWTLDGIGISGNLEFDYKPEMTTGLERKIDEILFKFHAVDRNKDGIIISEINAKTESVSVYRRPQTPLQLLRKGDGSSHTLVAMMEIDDQKLQDLGYSFVFGYTDKYGYDHVIDATPLRYCRTQEIIYNNPGIKMWVYSVWRYDDGSIVSSGKRYIDGMADEQFNASEFGGETANPVASQNPDSWMRISGNGVEINMISDSDSRIDVFDMHGRVIMSRSVKGGDAYFETLVFDRTEGNILMVRIVSGGDEVVKKIVVR